MNPKQESFCQEYVIDSNGTQAAIRAGYAVNSANVTSSKLLAKANIRARVDELFAEHRKRVEVTVDSLTELLLADRDLAHDTKQAGAAVSASDKLGKLHGLMSERLKIHVSVTVEHMNDAEVDAERERLELEYVSSFGREGIVERIARDEKLLVRFDRGEFDNILPPRLARVPKSPPLVVLGASEFQTAPSER